jgi:hypothetical protein
MVLPAFKKSALVYPSQAPSLCELSRSSQTLPNRFRPTRGTRGQRPTIHRGYQPRPHVATALLKAPRALAGRKGAA